MPPDLDIPGNDNEGSPSPPPPPLRPLREAPNGVEFAPIDWRANPDNIRHWPPDWVPNHQQEMLNADNRDANRYAIDSPPRPTHGALSPTRNATVNRIFRGLSEERLGAQDVQRRLREERLLARNMRRRHNRMMEEERFLEQMLAFIERDRANPMQLNATVNGRRNNEAQDAPINRSAEGAAVNGNDDNKVVSVNGSSEPSESLEH